MATSLQQILNPKVMHRMAKRYLEEKQKAIDEFRIIDLARYHFDREYAAAVDAKLGKDWASKISWDIER